jgi:hypothetical protein
LGLLHDLLPTASVTASVMPLLVNPTVPALAETQASEVLSAAH